MTDNRRSGSNLKIIAGTIVLLVLVFAALFAAARLVERKESRIKNGAFFDIADKTDVLLLGRSHVVNGIDPAKLYEDYGIAAYNMAGHGSILPVTYWTLVNALDYCDPYCVVIDPFLIEEDYHYVDEITDKRGSDLTENAVGQLHTVLDTFPYTRNKEAAIKDLILDPETRNEFRADFIRYHSRWSSLTAQDYMDDAGLKALNGRMGAEMRWNTEPPAQHYDLIPPDEKMDRETAGLEYLRRAVLLCQERGILVLLVNIPYEADPDYQRAANSVQNIADEMQVPYLNLMYAPGLIDTETDLSSITHLNAHGAAKVTAFVGEALLSIGTPDRRAEEGYEEWKAMAERNRREIIEHAVSAPDLYSALSMLQFDEISSIVFINDGSPALHDGKVKHLLEAAAGRSKEEPLEGFERAAEGSRAYCLVHDAAAGTAFEAYDGKTLEEFPASFGTVRFNTVPGIYNLVQIRRPEEEFQDGDNILNYDEHQNDDVQVILFDSAAGEEIGHLYFRYRITADLP
ncbi:MAG: hypothetical protein J6P87_09475 [Lachnospiraceae bacterium]|nr:hypothetical protein [Lachnospiraceae bacterium]